MPYAPRTSCGHQPCPTLVPRGESYCGAHQRDQNREYNDHRRPASHRFYQSPEWRKLRGEAMRVLGKRCVSCGSTDRIHVDHVIPISERPDLALELRNLRPLCQRCHNRARVRGRRIEKSGACASEATEPSTRALSKNGTPGGG